MAVNNEPLKITREQMADLLAHVADVQYDVVMHHMFRLWPEEPAPEASAAEKIASDFDAMTNPFPDTPSGRPERPETGNASIRFSDCQILTRDAYQAEYGVRAIHRYGDAEYEAGVAEGERRANADMTTAYMAGAEDWKARAEKAEARFKEQNAILNCISLAMGGHSRQPGEKNDLPTRIKRLMARVRELEIVGAEPIDMVAYENAIRHETVDRIKAGVTLRGGFNSPTSFLKVGGVAIRHDDDFDDLVTSKNIMLEAIERLALGEDDDG